MGDSEKRGGMPQRLIKVILPIVLIATGVWGYHYFSSRQVTMKRQRPPKMAAVVDTLTLRPGNHQTYVQAMGTVRPDREIVLKSMVTGEVTAVSPDFVQGGRLKKGEILLRLDDSDYQIEVKKAESALARALSDLELEEGHQKIAKEEFRLIQETSDKEMVRTDLALRKPQLTQARASIRSAEAELEKARLNLSRTVIRAPFNALILEKHVNFGSLVPAQGSVATLVDVDTYLVEALVPPDHLSAVRIHETDGSEAFVQSQYSEQTWQGRVVRTTGRMASQGRMAGVLISVPDPLGVNQKARGGPLLLDDYVDVRIKGRFLENVYAIPRTLLRDGNTLWVYRSGKLEIRPVDLLWKEDGRVFIGSGIQSGDRVITSDLPAPVNGMALQPASGDPS